MATFNLSGSVVGFGGSAGSNIVNLDLQYELVVGNLNQNAGVQARGLTRIDDNGNFSVPIDLPDDNISGMGPQSALIIHVRALVPAQNRHDADVLMSLSGSGQGIFDQLVAAAQGLQVEVDFTATSSLNMSYVLQDDVAQLDNIETLTVDMLTSENAPYRVGSAIARRGDDDVFRALLICRNEDLDQSSCWPLLHTGSPLPPGSPAAQIQAGRVYSRGRALNSGQEQREETSLTLMELNSATGIGTISNGLPQVINSGILSVRDLDLDFVNGRLRVVGRVSVAVGGIALFGFGRFEVHFTMEPPERGVAPFRNSEFDNPLNVTTFSHSYDISPDTDLDVINLPESMLETFLSGKVAQDVRERIQDAVRTSLNGQLDAQFDEVRDTVAALSSDPDSLVNEIRQSSYMQIDQVVMDADNLNVRAFVGVRHWASGLANLDCAANTVSVMFAAQRPRPMFKRYQKALSDKRLTKWVAWYYEHSKELSELFRKDFLLGGQMLRTALDLEPLIASKRGSVLSDRACERLLKLSQDLRKPASSNLRKVLDRTDEVLRQGRDCSFEQLIGIAGRSLEPKKPKRPKRPERKTTKKQ